MGFGAIMAFIVTHLIVRKVMSPFVVGFKEAPPVWTALFLLTLELNVWKYLKCKLNYVSVQWCTISKWALFLGRFLAIVLLSFWWSRWVWVWRTGGMILTRETEVLGEKHYTASVVDEWMSMENCWNDTD